MAATEPIFNVPRSVIWASGLMAAVQFVRKLLPDELSLTVLLALAADALLLGIGEERRVGKSVQDV